MGGSAVRGGLPACPDMKTLLREPALLGGTAITSVRWTRIFGPMAYVMPFSDESEAVSMVMLQLWPAKTACGPVIFARANRVAESMVAGNSWINAHNIFAHGSPMAGATERMGGGVLGPETFGWTTCVLSPSSASLTTGAAEELLCRSYFLRVSRETPTDSGLTIQRLWVGPGVAAGAIACTPTRRSARTLS